MVEFVSSLPDIYRDTIQDRGREPQFFLFMSFVITFGIVRFITISIRDGRKLPFIKNMSAGGTHIHHLVPGIFLLLISGYMSAALTAWWWRDVIAIIFGIGAALTLDEFALWLHLEDVYWLQEGRISLQAVFIFAGFVGFVGVGALFFWEVFRALLEAMAP
jgi:hypothetical protein